MAVQRKQSKGKMPADWQLVNLMDVVKINPNYKLHEQKEYDFLPMENVSEKFGGIIKYNRKIYAKQGASKFKKDDTIFAKITPCTENGKVAFIDNLESEVGYGSTEFLVFSPNKKHIHPNYLFWLLGSHKIHSRAICRMEGTTGRQRVPRNVFKDLLIGLPPIPEQHKIAEILSTVDDNIEKTDAIIEEKQQLKKGLMQKLFIEGIGHTRFKKTKIGRIPEGWKTIKLKDVIILSSGKARPKDFTPNYFKDNIYPIYGGNGIMGYSSEFNFENNTIILGRVGEYCGAVHRNNGRCWISDNALHIKKFKDDSFDLSFLALSLEYENLNKYKSKSGQPLISQGVLYPLYFALPHIEEQREISAIISEIDSKIENEQNYKSELEQLKKGLLQVLLTGKVRVKVP